jgi:hypothetical protein
MYVNMKQLNAKVINIFDFLESALALSPCSDNYQAEYQNNKLPG